jgi:hypothetical protein
MIHRLAISSAAISVVCPFPHLFFDTGTWPVPIGILGDPEAHVGIR